MIYGDLLWWLALAQSWQIGHRYLSSGSGSPGRYCPRHHSYAKSSMTGKKQLFAAEALAITYYYSWHQVDSDRDFPGRFRHFPEAPGVMEVPKTGLLAPPNRCQEASGSSHTKSQKLLPKVLYIHAKVQVQKLSTSYISDSFSKGSLAHSGGILGLPKQQKTTKTDPKGTDQGINASYSKNNGTIWCSRHLLHPAGCRESPSRPETGYWTGVTII